MDALAMNKMNKLHIHITDSQSWPLDIPSIPDLAAKGAYHPGLIYTAKDLANLQRYGSLRGIEVFLEIDMPGHTSAIWYSNPDLIASFNVQPEWGVFAAEPPSGTLKLNSSKVDAFITKIFQDLLPRVSPYSSHFHSGGDEVNMNAYGTDETVKTSNVMKLRPYMQRFIDRIHKQVHFPKNELLGAYGFQVREAGLTPIVWEEMITDWSLKLGKDTIVQAWQGPSAIEIAVREGYRVIAGSNSHWVCQREKFGTANVHIVFGLRSGRMAQLGHKPIISILWLQPTQQLEGHVRLQPTLTDPRGQEASCDWRRGARLVRTD
jgi:hexosaminidase